jgi:GT2 family glycosyltransferase/glycosyltransferase involved in cell wall biosynthesis
MYSLLRRLMLLLLTMIITPGLALLSLVLFAINLIDRIAHAVKPEEPAGDQPLSGLASIIILNWNGRDLLEQGLPSVVAAVRNDGRDHEIMVVDNGSSDESVAYLRREFPQVKVLALAANLGFARGNNAGVQAARHDVAVLLNNDMLVDPGFLRPLLDGFGPQTFAVSSQIFLQDPAARREETGRTAAAFRRGMIDFTHRDVDGRNQPRPYYPVFWAGGGSSAFHRERFLKLGGFQEIFSPAYVEDTDLSYQAWKRGWQVLFAPQSVVYHKHRATSARRFSPAGLQALILRNQLLFIWKNISSWRLLIGHAFFLPWNCYRLARDHGPRIWSGMFSASLRIPSLAAARLRVPCRAHRSDAEIFSLSASPGRYFAGLRHDTRRPPGDRAARPPHLLWLTAYLPHLGRHAGAGRMFQLLQRMARRYRITLLTFLESDEEREFLPEVERICERVIAMRRHPPRRWQLFAYEPFDEFRTPQMDQAVQECLEHEDFDLVQLEYTQMACYADREFGIPTLLTKHEVDFAACARRARTEKRPWNRVRWFYNYLQVLDREIRLLRDLDAAICMTEPDKRELEKFSRLVPVHVISTGVDLDYFRPPQPRPDNQRLIFVGAFQHHPNVDAMIHFCRTILPQIKKRAPSAELDIVGSNTPQQIADLAAIPGVQVTGFVPDIRPSMASSSVYIVPLRLGVGIRGKILEAWAMAMPVVATPVAAAGLQAESGRNILIADSEEQFAEHVVSLLRDPTLRARLGTEGRQVAERYYGWDAAADKLDGLYRHYLATEGS